MLWLLILKSWISNLERKVFCYKIKPRKSHICALYTGTSWDMSCKKWVGVSSSCMYIFKRCKAIIVKAYSCFDFEAHNVHSYYAVPLKLEELQSMRRMEAWMGTWKTDCTLIIIPCNELFSFEWTKLVYSGWYSWSFLLVEHVEPQWSDNTVSLL